MNQLDKTLSCLAALFVGLAAIGCGDDPPPPPPPPAPPAPATSAPKLVLPTATATATASAAPLALGSALLAPTGPIRWPDFAGPNVAPPVKPGELAWAAMPVSTGWETLKFGVLKVDRVEENFAVFSLSLDGAKQPNEFFVPGAFIASIAKNEGLKLDDAVVVATGGSRTYGRVLEAPADGKVKVRYRFAGLQEDAPVELSHVRKLDDTLDLAAPCAVRREKEEGTKRLIVYQPGQFVHAAEGKAWYIAGSGKPERTELSSVKPMIVSAIHKVGDTVWVAQNDELVAGKVAEVMDGGTRYRVTIEGGTEAVAGMESVTSPIK